MKTPFITITSDHLESLDQLLHSGARGTHLLFSLSMIRDAFTRRPELAPLELEEAAQSLQPVISDLLLIDDLDERREIIQSLDPAVRDLLVHLYFGFIERYLSEEVSPEVVH